MSEATLTFLGAAGTVTGSKHLVRTKHSQVLLDCGLFQGLKELRQRNWQSPPFDVAALDAIVLSHAHIDHSGYLPLVAKHGYRGPIFCTPGTADLLRIVLPDSAGLQEEDADRANRRHYSKHHPALPLYTMADAEMALHLLREHRYGEDFHVTKDVRAHYRRAGHILGSATVSLAFGSSSRTRLAFSGDLGRWDRPILRDPEFVPDADILLLESTYGNRIHPVGAEEELVRVINETAHRGGVVVVPAFAIGRTQELIWMIRKLENEGRLPLLSVYVDSPMAIDVTGTYVRHPEDLDGELTELIATKDYSLSTHGFHLVNTAAESKSLNRLQGPVVFIAGSGMAAGGRVLHHLKFRLPDHRNTVLLTGFQAAGTRGRALLEGARTVRIHGEDIPVRARVEVINGLSAHADQNELLRWLGGFERPPLHTYLVHGEPEASRTLAGVIERELGWDVSIAVDGATVPLTASRASVAR